MSFRKAIKRTSLCCVKLLCGVLLKEISFYFLQIPNNSSYIFFTKMINKRLLLLTLFCMCQSIEARIVSKGVSTTLSFSQNASSEEGKFIEVELSCKAQVNDHLPNVYCYKECSKYFKDKGGWFHQNSYYHNNEAWKNLDQVVEIATDQDTIVECQFSPAPSRSEQGHERIKRSPSLPLPPLECDTDFQYIKEFDSCLKISSEIANWAGASYSCESQGGSLVSIDSKEKQNAIRTMLGERVDVYWIGLNDIRDEGNFVWDDGTPLCYSSWDEGEPNNERNDENCVFIWKFYADKDRNYTWNDSLCHLRYRFICQKKRQKDLTRKKQEPSLDTGISTANCPENWSKSTASDTCYHVGSEVNNFGDAVAYCRNAGGSLASIDNFFEQQFLNEFLKGKNVGDVWTGYNDRREEGNFEWTDDTEACYSRWIRTQPDNAGDQDCVKLVRQSEYKWDDELCSLLLQPLCKQKAKQLYVHTCPSGCLLVMETVGDNQGIEKKCTTAAPGSRFCSSTSQAPVSKPVLYDISHPVDEWSQNYCGSQIYDIGIDLKSIYAANDSAAEYEKQGFIVTPITVYKDQLVKYKIANSTHTRTLGGSTVDKVGGGVKARRSVTLYMAVFGNDTKTAKGIKWFCGGAIINRKWVLSAAHCFNDGDPQIVRLGDYNVKDDTATASELPLDFKVKRLLQHPDYRYPSAYHDLALIELNRDIPYFRPDMRPVCLPWDTEADRNLVGNKVTVTGWGAKFFGGQYSEVAQEVTVTVFDANQCDKSYSITSDYEIKFPKGIGPTTTLCAGDVNGIKDSCQGDSGGPAVYTRKDNKFTLAGIVSTGHGCGLKDYPGIYIPMNNPKYLTWVKQIAFS